MKFDSSVEIQVRGVDVGIVAVVAVSFCKHNFKNSIVKIPLNQSSFTVTM